MLACWRNAAARFCNVVLASQQTCDDAGLTLNQRWAGVSRLLGLDCLLSRVRCDMNAFYYFPCFFSQRSRFSCSFEKLLRSQQT